MNRDNVGPDPVTPCKPERAGHSMAEFDTLPAPMRKLLADAPFDFATHPAKLLVEERGLDAAIDMATKNIPLFVDESACSDYGADHPQCVRKPVK